MSGSHEQCDRQEVTDDARFCRDGVVTPAVYLANGYKAHRPSRPAATRALHGFYGQMCRFVEHGLRSAATSGW